MSEAAHGQERLVRLLVTGSRGWPTDEWATVYNVLGELYIRAENRGEEFLLIHGGAEGADSLASDWSDDSFIDAVEEYPPDYERHGSRAPHVRNDEMLDICDYVVAFWDGKSRGTKSVIDKAIKRGLPFEVHSPAGVYVEIPEAA